MTVQGGRADWKPETAVVFVGSDTAPAAAGDDCCPPNTNGIGAVADRCCGVMNFFVSPDTARDWSTSHPKVSGVVLTKEQAFRMGVDIFGHLLND